MEAPDLDSKFVDKIELADLAIYPQTGAPLFSKLVPVGRPSLGSRAVFEKYVDQIWETHIVTNNGPLVQQLERRIADMHAVKHAVAVCNGTIGLEQALGALFPRGGRVIVPSFTFVATVHALVNAGLAPLFCDIDERTHTLNPAHAEQLIKANEPNVVGILGVHLWGQLCHSGAIAELADKYGLRVLYDSAHAFGCAGGERLVGNFGACEILSLHSTKIVGAGEGGIILTNNDQLAAALRLDRQFGFRGYDNVVAGGTNAKMSELAAAMALTNLDFFAEFVRRNRAYYRAYKDGLQRIPGIDVYNYEDRAARGHEYRDLDPALVTPDLNKEEGYANTYNYQYVVVLVDERKFGMRRDQLVHLLLRENVSARRYFYPGVHRMAVSNMVSRVNHELELPVTNRVAEQVMCLPTGSAMTVERIKAVCRLIRFAHVHAPTLASTCGDSIE